MTDNQARAKKYLDKYRIAKKDLKYLADRLEAQRVKAEGIKSSLDIKKGLKGNIEVPYEGQGTYDPLSKQRLLDVLIYQSMEYDQRMEQAEKLCLEIERFIDANCPGIDALILKYRYIKLLTYEQIAVNVNYSYWHTKRRHWKALERLGKKMAPNGT